MSSTQLPLVIAITTVATETHHMCASTAAALIGAAVLSTLVYPMLGLRLRATSCTHRRRPSPLPARCEPLARSSG